VTILGSVTVARSRSSLVTRLLSQLGQKNGGLGKMKPSGLPLSGVVATLSFDYVERITERHTMLPSDFRNLRSGPVMEAVGINSSTVRAWIRNNGFKLGDRESRESGNPRYDLADVARLTMMEFLTDRLGMPAQPAVTTTNFAWDTFALLADAELAAIGERKRSECPRLIMLLERVDGLHRPRIITYAELVAETDARSSILETRIELREIVRMARDRLAYELGVSTSDFRHDFADAPEGTL
jgi:hypothetical protein